MFVNKVLLKWKHPNFVIKSAIKRMSAKDYFIIYANFIWKWALGTFIVFTILRWFSPRSIYSFFDLEILGIVFFIVVAVSFIWLLTLIGNIISTEVSFRKKDICIISASGVAIIKYLEIQSCTISEVSLNEQTFNILEIKNWDGNKSVIEICPKVRPESIVEILKSKNIQMTQSLFNQPKIYA
jgi:hypothetical protein